MSGYESPAPEEETGDSAPAPEDVLADGSAEARGGSREEPPRDTSEDTGLVSPGSTADGAGTSDRPGDLP